MAKPKIPPVAPSGIVDLPVPAARKASEYLDAYKSWVFAATQATAEKVASTELKLFKKRTVGKKQEIVQIDEHPALSLLHDVNDFMTSYHLREITQTYLDLTGEAYWAILRNGENNEGKPTELWPLRPDWISVIPSENFIAGYRYRPQGNVADEVIFKVEDIVPFKYPNPINPYRGRGQVQGAAMAVDIDTFSAEWNRNFFFNSAMPSMVFSTDKNITAEQIKRLMTQWESKFQGRSNAHKIAFLGGGLKPDRLSQSPKEMDFIEQRKMMRDEILGMFRVPKSVLGITEDVNRANAEASKAVYAENVIVPRLIRFVSYLNEFYLTNWPNEGLFFDFVNPVPEDMDMKLKMYENGLKNGWLTINEVRDEENRPPVEGGDQIYLPLILQPVGQTAPAKLFSKLTGNYQEKDQVLTLKVKGSTKKKQEFSMPVPPKTLRELRKDEIKKEIKHDLLKLVRNLIVEKPSKKKKATKNEETPQEETKPEIQRFQSGWDEKKRTQHWEKLIAKTDVLEEKMITIVHPLMAEQEQDVKNRIANALKSRTPKRRKAPDDATAQFLFNMITENARWKSQLAPFIRNIVEDKGAEVLSFLGINSALDLTQQAAASYLQLDGINFIKDVNRTTRDALRKTLSEGLQNEEGIPQLQKRVATVFEAAKGSRAEMIARTEIARSTTFATVEAYKQSGVVQYKEWLTAADERVDSTYCVDLEGETVPIDEPFKSAGELVEGPPIHPNCRCTVIPVLKDVSLSLDTGVDKAKETVDIEEETAKAKKEIDEYLKTQKAKAVKEAEKEAAKIKEAAEEEKKGIIAEVKGLRDKIRDKIYGSK